ncbi:MAG: glycosyltransferase family 2 protein [Bacteroidia bacterium]|nr:glycosyltransferase family 2 protein [Bacteroidia bacterium]MCC6768949.1 glycosyltransferase family 2 protein [Bacteroidia bacterium]
MKVSGFTFIRNAVRYDYPLVESVRSIIPLCNEVIVMAGNSNDNTHELLAALPLDTVKIYHSTWDDTLREGGRVLALETDKALAEVKPGTDWAFYIQADEVLHEQFIEPLYAQMQKYKDDQSVEGLLFNYVHFYGSYNYIGDSRKWYRNEVRVIRPGIGIRSYRDAQGFRLNNKPLRVKPAQAAIYHYGWVKPPDKQQEKQKFFHKLWHSDKWMQENIPDTDTFDYSAIDSVAPFNGTHPAVMQNRIKQANWNPHIDPAKKKLSFRYKILMWFEKHTGIRIGEYKNYRLIPD